MLPAKWYVLGGNLGRNVKEVWWYACLTRERRLVLKAEAEPTEVDRGEAGGAPRAVGAGLGCWRWCDGRGLGWYGAGLYSAGGETAGRKAMKKIKVTKGLREEERWLKV